MELLIFVILIVALSFGFVVFFGAPYVPSLRQYIDTAFELLDLKPGQVLIEFGSGDGSVLLEAARRGIRVYGYEINPILVVLSRLRTWRYRHLVKVIWGNGWKKSWPETDGVYVFGVAHVVEKLHKKIMQYTKKEVRLVSIGFDLKSVQPDRQKNGVFLYVLNNKE